MMKYQKVAGLALSVAMLSLIPSTVVAEQKVVSKQPTAVSLQSHKRVILTKADLSNWEQSKARSVDLANQIKDLPRKRELMSRVTSKLDEINSLMLNVEKLQKNVPKNRAALKRASSKLKRYEKEIKSLLQELEESLSTIGDDAQLANIDLQNAVQKQQQLIQMLSTISKTLHDTQMAIIRKIS